VGVSRNTKNTRLFSRNEWCRNRGMKPLKGNQQLDPYPWRTLWRSRR
jgi:hypothetical protein